MASRCSLKGTQLAGAGDRKKCLISGSTREHDQEGDLQLPQYRLGSCILGSQPGMPQGIVRRGRYGSWLQDE